MKLLYLNIKQYKKFNGTEIFFGDYKENPIEKSIFKNMDITTLIGENGSGKTTILSFISKIFRYLQRNQNEIPSEFNFKYEINTNIVELSKRNSSVFIKINRLEKKLLLEYDLKKGYVRKPEQEDINLESVTYDDIKEYLPSKVIVSYFDIDYPKGYTHNYIGDRLLCLNVGHAYHKESSLGLDISLGVFRFLKKYHCGEDKYFTNLLDSLGLNFSNNVCAYFTLENRAIEDIDVLKDISEILKRYNIKNTGNIIKQIVSGEYFSKYFKKNIRNTNMLYSMFDVKKYINHTNYNVDLLEYVITKGFFYINDFYIRRDNLQYSMSSMSTGEKMLVGRIFFILSNISENDIVIIEEPEIHLNYSWVKQILSIFIILFRDYKSHFIISSHNYPFINNLFSSQILVMDNKRITNPGFKTLLCLDDELNLRVFKKANVKNFIEHYIQELLTKNDIEKLKYIFEYLGDSYTKVKIFKRLVEVGEINVEDTK